MRDGPLTNSIRSFWTPEFSRDPEILRLIRLDKVAVATMSAALLLVAAGLVVCVIGLASIPR